MKPRTFCVHMGGQHYDVKAEHFHHDGGLGVVTFYLDGRAVALFDVAEVVCIMEVEPIILVQGAPETK